MAQAPAPVCPECSRSLEEGAFQCPHCELILESAVLEDDEAPREPTLIRAMLSPPQAKVSRANIQVPQELREAARNKLPREVTAPTVVMTFVVGSRDIPSVVASIDLTAFSLSEFEAFVISMMDGQSNVESLRQVVGLTKPEMMAVLQALKQKGVIDIREPPEKPAPARKPTPPPAPVAAEDVGLTLDPVTDPKIKAPAPPPPPPRQPTPPVRPATPPTPSGLRTPVSSSGNAVPLRTSPAIDAFLKSVKEGKRPPPSPTPPPPPPLSSAAMSPLQRAIALEQAGNIERAIEVLEQAVARSKDPAPLYNRLGIVLIKERRDFARAESCLEKARKLDPDNPVYEKNYFRIVAMNAAMTGMRANPFLSGR